MRYLLSLIRQSAASAMLQFLIPPAFSVPYVLVHFVFLFILHLPCCVNRVKVFLSKKRTFLSAMLPGRLSVPGQITLSIINNLRITDYLNRFLFTYPIVPLYSILYQRSVSPSAVTVVPDAIVPTISPSCAGVERIFAPVAASTL